MPVDAAIMNKEMQLALMLQVQGGAAGDGIGG